MSKVRRNALRWAQLSTAVAMALAPSARAATSLYWDTNGTTAGSGAATGTWGTSNFWNTDPTGGAAGSFTTTTASSNDVFFSAGTNGTTGTVTVSGAVLADSINFQNNVAITLSGGTSITLGGDANPGIAVLSGDNAANTISTAVILNSAATSELFSNAGTGLLTVGAITGAATSGTQTITLTSTSTGGITLNGVIGNGAAGGNVALVINNAGTGASTLSGTNTFTGGVTINGGTLIVTADLNLGAVPAAPAVALTINGGTLQENTGFNMAANRRIAIGTAGATFNENATANFNIAGVIQDAGPGAGALTITGTGTGIYVPAAQNTYSGGTHLLAGTTTVVNSNSTGSASTGNLTSGPFGIGTLFMDGGKQRAQTGGTNDIVGNAVQITADSTFLFSSGSTDTLTFTGPVTLVGGDRTITQQSLGDITFSGVIGDGGSNRGLILGAASTNRLVLSAANTYTGATTVNGGTLVASVAGALSSGNAIVNGGTLLLANATGSATNGGTITLNGGTLASGAIGGAGAVVAGTGAHTIAAGGGAAGTLSLSNVTANNFTTFNFAPGAAWTTTPATTGSLLNVTASNGLLVNTGSGRAQLSFVTNPLATGFYRLIQYNGTFNGTSPDPNTLIQVPVAPAGDTYTLVDSPSGDVGFIELQVTNSGVVVTSNWLGAGAGPNSWTTPGNWDNGVPGNPGDSATFGTSAGSTNQTVTMDSQQHVGTLVFNNTTASPGNYTIAAGSGGSLFLDNGAGAATLTNNFGNNTISAPLTLASNTNATIAAGSSLTVSGVVSGTGGLSVAGPGTLQLLAGNTYTGGTTLTNLNVLLDSNTALGTAAVTIAGGGAPVTLQALTAARTLANVATINGDVTFAGTTANNNLTLTGAVTLGASPNITVSNAGVTATLSGAISGAGFGITKQGPGALSLGGANTFTGGVTLNAGTLNINNAAALGATSGTFTINGGTTINSSAAAVTVSTNNPQTWAGDFTFTGSNALNLGTGAVTLTASRQVTVSASTLTVGGAIGDGGGGLGLTKLGPGTLTLTGANTYTGGTTAFEGPTSGLLTQGTLLLDFNAAASAATILPATSTLTLGGSTASPAQAVLGGAVFRANGKSAAASSQAIAGITFGTGADGVTAVANGTGGTIALNLGALARGVGAAVNFTNPAGTLSGTNGILTGNGAASAVLTDANGTAYAIVGGTDWASKDASNTWIAALPAGSYTAFAASGALAAGSNVDVTGTGTLTASAAATVNTIRFNGTSTTAATLTLTGTNTISAGGILFGSAAGAADTITGGTIRAGAGNELVIQNYSSKIPVISSIIADSASGSSALTIRSFNGTTGQGDIRLNAANTYTGNTYIVAGRVAPNSAVATLFGVGGSVFVDGNTDGQYFQNQAITLANNFFVLGTGWSESGGPFGVLRVDAGTLSGTITMLGDSSFGAQNSAGTISGKITGNFNLTKVGASTLTLSNTANANGGTTTVAAGILEATNAGAYAGLATPGKLVTNNGTTLAAAVGGSGQWTSAQLDTLLANATFNPTSFAGFDTTGGNFTYASNMPGAYGVNKLGLNVLTLSGTNNYAGPSKVTAGVLEFAKEVSLYNNNQANWTAANLLPAANTILAFNVGGPGEFTTADIGTLAAVGSATGGFISNSSIGFDLTNAPGGALTYSSVIANPNAGANALGVANIAPGTTLTLGAANTYSGPTWVYSGTIKAGVDNAFGNGTSVLTFGDTTARTGAADLSIANVTVGGITVQSNTATANTITIGTGKTLTAAGITMGINSPTAATTSNLTVSGAGALVVTGNVQIGVSQSTVNAGNNSSATLDLSGLTGAGQANAFTANVTNFNVGQGNTSSGFLILSNNGNSITASVINVANSNGNNGGPGTPKLTLGSGTNTIKADTINIGLSKLSGTMSWASPTTPGPGSVTITNAAGSGASAITIGSNNGTGTAGVPVGTLDLRGHSSTVAASTLAIGIGSNTSTGGATGVLNFDTGTFTATTVTLGSKSGTGGTGQGNGTIALSGGAFTVNPGGSFVMATNSAATGTAVGNLTLTGGTFTTNADITKGGGTATTANLTLNGGTLDLLGHNIGGATLIDNALFQAGTLRNLGQFNNGAVLNKTTTGTLSLTGASGNAYTGGTTVTAGTLLANSPNAIVGSTGSGAVVVNTGGTLAGGLGTTAGFVVSSASVNGITVNSGGTISAGNGATTSSATGVLNTAGGNPAGGTPTFTQTWNAGGTYAWKLNSANAGATQAIANGTSDAGGAGANWDMLIMPSLNTPSTGTFAINIVPVTGTGSNAFNGANSYTWTIADITGTAGGAGIYQGGTSVPSSNYASLLANNFVLNTAAFTTANPTATGVFSLGLTSDGTANGQDLVVNYSAAPEPTSLGLLGLGAGVLLCRRRRRR